MTYIVTENRKKYKYMDPEYVPFGSDLSRRDSVRMRSRITVGDLQIVTRTALFRGLKPETVERIIGPATAVLLHPHERAARQDQPATLAELPYDKIIIASRLGLSSEYLSRAFARLRTIDVVVKGSQVSVRDIAQLRNFAVVDRKIAREERSNRCNAGSQR